MYTFKFRRASKFAWTKVNPVLAIGEPGFEKDTGKFKIGDGVKSWDELEYYTAYAPITNSSLEEHVISDLPHPVYDDGPSLFLLYENAKV